MTVSIAHPGSSHYFVVYLLQKLMANFLGTHLNVTFDECSNQEKHLIVSALEMTFFVLFGF